MMHKIKTIYVQLFDNYIKDRNISEETKIIYVYRYLSWTLTCIAYLADRPYSIIFFKLGVIVSLFISSKIITNLYIRFKNNQILVRTLVLIETVGITLLLLPTGGLKSPFIWYALNPTLVAASYMPAYFCWMNLMFYLITGSAMSYVLFNKDSLSILEMLMGNTNLILVFALITLAVQLLAGLSQRLFNQTIALEKQKNKMEEINKALEMSNIQKEEAIDHIMSLYHIMEALNNHNSKDKMFEVLVSYTAKLTKCILAFIWFPGRNKDLDLIKTSKDISLTDKQDIIYELRNLGFHGSQIRGIQDVRVKDKEFIISPIISSSTYFGLIAIQKTCDLNIGGTGQNIKLLEFIAELVAVTLERFNLEDMEDRLLVMEEQNRIANEIHDSVSQRLFSISYAIYGILGRWQDVSKEELKDYLSEIRESSNSAMKELRNSIYKLSSKKKGEKSFQVTLKNFLDNISKLNSVIIDLEIQGDENILSLSLKKCITRIIREACSNAIRHGKCKHINCSLVIYKEHINLSIIDDGIGFVMEEDVSNQKGLGISNMRNLVGSFNGSIEINSEVGKGTQVQIMIPGKDLTNVARGGVAI